MSSFTPIPTINAAIYLLENGASDDKVFLVHGKNHFTFGQLRIAVRNVAAHLLGNGLSKGDRVLIVDDSSFFWVCSYLGTLLAGGVTVPLPTNVDLEKAGAIISSCLPGTAFVAGRYLEKYQPALVNIPVVVDVSTAEGNGFDNILQAADFPGVNFPTIDDSRDLAALMYTSGSTGEPRGVMVTHRNIIANTRSIVQYMSLRPEDRMMAILPFYYCFGTSLLHTHLKVGGSVVVENSFLFPEKVLNRMEETECTGLAGVPSTYQILLRNTTFKRRDLPSVMYFQQAGGKLPVNFIEDLLKAFPTKQLLVMYGQTEATARLSYLAPELLKEKLGSIGKSIPGVILEVLDPNGKQVQPGEVGEIVAMGENITAGYWKSPEETAQAFRDGKLFTGDLARVDEDGFIYVVDRAKEFIKCSGHRVSSKEIEEILLRMEGVIEAAAVPKPDDILGEAVCVFVSHVEGEKAAEEVKKFCKQNIKWPFTPKETVCMKTLPKNTSGKVDKVRLKKLLGKNTDKGVTH